MNPLAKVFKILGIAYLAVTILLGLTAGAFALKTQIFLSHAVETQGEVVDFISGRSIRPVVEFETEEGDTISKISRVGTTPTPFELGDKITVYYKADEPQKFHLDWLPDLWLVPLILGGIAGLFLLFTIGFYGAGVIMERRQSK